MTQLIPAVQTMAAIEECVRRDQGNTYRMWLERVIPHIGDAYRSDDEGFRTHLGASVIGDECERKVWYGFRWATKPMFEGRLLRLFNRGHLEEARFIALMLTIGCEVYQQDEHGKQFRISDHGGHFGGSLDSKLIGIPDLPPGTVALGEYKTHNDKSFQNVKANGVREAKPEHYTQMQIYMRKQMLSYGVYFAVNKNDDEIWAEVVPIDHTHADGQIARAGKIIFMQTAPAKLSKSPGFFKCKWCDHRPVCHLSAPPARNCRTCQHAIPLEDGRWSCTSEARQMTMLFGPRPGVSDEGENYFPDKKRQLRGCDYWEKHAGM